MTLRQALDRAEQMKATQGTNLFGYPPMWIAMRKEGNEWYSAIEMPNDNMEFMPGGPRAWLSHDKDPEGTCLCNVILIEQDPNLDWEVYDHRIVLPVFHSNMDRLNEGLDHHPIARARDYGV